MGTAYGAYFVPIKPGSGEGGTYNRRADVDGHFLFTARTFSWEWVFSSGYAPPGGVWPAVRLRIDDAPGDWLQPTANKYVFPLTVENGHHGVRAEIAGQPWDWALPTIAAKDTLAARPPAVGSRNYYYATDKARLYWDSPDAGEWVWVVAPLGKGFVVNDTGQPLPTQGPIWFGTS